MVEEVMVLLAVEAMVLLAVAAMVLLYTKEPHNTYGARVVSTKSTRCGAWEDP